MSFWCHRLDQNSNDNIVRISALNFFVASWGLPGSCSGLFGDLVSNVINKEALFEINSPLPTYLYQSLVVLATKIGHQGFPVSISVVPYFVTLTCQVEQILNYLG